MCRDRDGLITATKDQTRDYAVAYADAVEIAAKEKMGPMRLRVLEKLCSYFLKWWEDYQELPMEGIRDPAIAALKEFVSKARTKVWAQLHMEVPVLRAAKAWTQGTIKIEYSVTPGTDAAELFQKVVYPYLRKQGHRQMIGVEPKWDLERKLQALRDKDKSDKKAWAQISFSLMTLTLTNTDLLQKEGANAVQHKI